MESYHENIVNILKKDDPSLLIEPVLDKELYYMATTRALKCLTAHMKLEHCYYYNGHFSPLIFSVMRVPGSADLIIKFIDEGFDINHIFYDEEDQPHSIFEIACGLKDLTIAKYLLKMDNLNVNFKNVIGTNNIFKDELWELVINHPNFDPNYQDVRHHKMPLLFEAVVYGDKSNVDKVLALPNVNRDLLHERAHVLLQCKTMEMFDYLISKGFEFKPNMLNSISFPEEFHFEIMKRFNVSTKDIENAMFIVEYYKQRSEKDISIDDLHPILKRTYSLIVKSIGSYDYDDIMFH